MLQTAFVIGDSDSIEAIVDSFDMYEEDALNTGLELDLVFSNSGTFFEQLFKLLPKVMDKRLKLIREACSLQHLDILPSILLRGQPRVVKPGAFLFA